MKLRSKPDEYVKLNGRDSPQNLPILPDCWRSPATCPYELALLVFGWSSRSWEVSNEFLRALSGNGKALPRPSRHFPANMTYKNPGSRLGCEIRSPRYDSVSSSRRSDVRTANPEGNLPTILAGFVLYRAASQLPPPPPPRAPLPPLRST